MNLARGKAAASASAPYTALAKSVKWRCLTPCELLRRVLVPTWSWQPQRIRGRVTGVPRKIRQLVADLEARR